MQIAVSKQSEVMTFRSGTGGGGACIHVLVFFGLLLVP